jgi:hypothetical protein
MHRPAPSEVARPRLSRSIPGLSCAMLQAQERVRAVLIHSAALAATPRNNEKIPGIDFRGI